GWPAPIRSPAAWSSSAARRRRPPQRGRCPRWSCTTVAACRRCGRGWAPGRDCGPGAGSCPPNTAWSPRTACCIPYDRPLDPQRAEQLRPGVASALGREMATHGVPEEILLVAEPLYLVLLADLLALPARPRVQWIPDHANGWPQARAVLDDWGW